MAGFDGSDRPSMDSAQAIMRGALAEFLAMMLFVYFGCGSAASNAEKNTRNFTLADGSSVAVSEWNPASVTIIALQFGLGITVLAYFCAHSSGGHINCAVTWALVLVGKCHPVTGFVYFVAQMLGSIAGALLLKFTTFAISDGPLGEVPVRGTSRTALVAWAPTACSCTLRRPMETKLSSLRPPWLCWVRLWAPCSLCSSCSRPRVRATRS